jgi:hypothetical protein
MTYAGGMVTCKGKWAMSDQAHDVEGQSSDFEFKLLKADQDSPFFPINGKYQGFFLIKQALPLKGSIKVEDKEMIMKFTPNDEGGHHISGDGYNKLGKFTLRGTLADNGAVHLYREYYQFFPPAAVATPKKALTMKKDNTSADKKKKDSNIPEAPVAEAVTPGREGGQRIRKQSSYLKEFHDPLQKPIARSTSKEIKSVNIPPPPMPQAIPVHSSSSGLERSHRLSPAMKKCSDLLKELTKLHQSQWFLEPVDPVKYNIPDYPKIIKQPMDFSTIRGKIENGLYESINAFAEDMRLVFRNAVTYNQARDSLVNIAAREISSKFEDKFRILVTQLDPASMTIVDPKISRGPGSFQGIKRSKSKDFGMRSMMSRPGPRPFQAQFSLPPAAVDGSTMKIMEMQHIIQNMQDELKQLRTVVKESEITKRLTESKEAAQNPLSFDEKKSLVGQIHKLTPDKMERVLSIIQEAMPHTADGVVEVPIDSLDTLTLRKLQQFVSANVPEKKKRAYTIRTDGANKRPRKSRTPKSGSLAGHEGFQSQDDQQELGLFDQQDDDLLFEAETFEDMEEMETGDKETDDYAREIMLEYEKLKKNGNVFVDSEHGVKEEHGLDSPHDGVTSSGNDVEEDDDDNLWDAAAAEMQNKKQPQYDVYPV